MAFPQIPFLEEEMKTLFGATYQQLNSLTAEEINEIQSAFAMSQMREALSIQKLPQELIDKCCEIGLVETLKLMNETLDEATYSTIRQIYDTEEKFNLAVDLTVKMGNMGIRTQPMMEQIITEVLKAAGIPRD